MKAGESQSCEWLCSTSAFLRQSVLSKFPLGPSTPLIREDLIEDSETSSLSQIPALGEHITSAWLGWRVIFKVVLCVSDERFCMGRNYLQSPPFQLDPLLHPHTFLFPRSNAIPAHEHVGKISEESAAQFNFRAIPANNSSKQNVICNSHRNITLITFFGTVFSLLVSPPSSPNKHI